MLVDPAMTYRDANAHTLIDFLDTSRPPALLEPPQLAGPGDVAANQSRCDTSDPRLKVLPRRRRSGRGWSRKHWGRYAGRDSPE